MRAGKSGTVTLTPLQTLQEARIALDLGATLNSWEECWLEKTNGAEGCLKERRSEGNASDLRLYTDGLQGSCKLMKDSKLRNLGSLIDLDRYFNLRCFSLHMSFQAHGFTFRHVTK